ncbi:preprotein translocase subunit SecG [Woodsholea maritima]|uniref:preprotein translocase subunit SecG n=1 Tax=Woodsholea maritima TaxID=240237 RepID=UPI00035CDAD3|nr:preprotein translocase subunit SecG [Woodsholea maritima]
MHTVLLIIHLIVAAGLVTVVLLQRSEGGALGIGGSPGGMMSGRGAANLLTRLTMILGAVFIVNSILLAIVSGVENADQSVVERLNNARQPGEITVDDLGLGTFTEVPTDEASEPVSVPADVTADLPASLPEQAGPEVSVEVPVEDGAELSQEPVASGDEAPAEPQGEEPQN